MVLNTTLHFRKEIAETAPQMGVDLQLSTQYSSTWESIMESVQNSAAKVEDLIRDSGDSVAVGNLTLIPEVESDTEHCSEPSISQFKIVICDSNANYSNPFTKSETEIPTTAITPHEVLNDNDNTSEGQDLNVVTITPTPHDILKPEIVCNTEEGQGQDPNAGERNESPFSEYPFPKKSLRFKEGTVFVERNHESPFWKDLYERKRLRKVLREQRRLQLHQERLSLFEIILKSFRKRKRKSTQTIQIQPKKIGSQSAVRNHHPRHDSNSNGQNGSSSTPQKPSTVSVGTNTEVFEDKESLISQEGDKTSRWQKVIQSVRLWWSGIHRPRLRNDYQDQYVINGSDPSISDIKT